MAEGPKLLDYTMDQMQSFGQEYIKHNILFVRVDTKKKRDLRYQALKQMSRALNLPCEGAKFTQTMLQECSNYRVRFDNLLKHLVRQVSECWRPGEAALRLAPPWVRLVEARLRALDDVLASMGRGEDAAGSIDDHIFDQSQTVGTPAPSDKGKGGKKKKKGGKSHKNVRNERTRTVWGQEVRLVREMARAASQQASLEPCLAHLLPKLVDHDVITDIWRRVRSVAVEKLQALVAAGDDPRLLGHAAPSALDWQVLDVELLYGDVELVSEDSVELEPQRRALAVLSQLVARHGLEAGGPRATPEARGPEAEAQRGALARRWVRLRRDYCVPGACLSAIALQKRWHDLKVLTRRTLRAVWRSPARRVHAVYVSVARRFPRVVTEPLPSWPDLVRGGGTLMPAELTLAEATLDSDPQRLAPTPPPAPAAPPPPAAPAETPGRADQDDDIVLIEKEIETIEVRDEDEEPSEAPAEGLSLVEEMKEMLRQKLSPPSPRRHLDRELTPLGPPTAPPPGEPTSPNPLDLNHLDPTKVQATLKFESESDNEPTDDDQLFIDVPTFRIATTKSTAASDYTDIERNLWYKNEEDEQKTVNKKRSNVLEGVKGPRSKKMRYSNRPSRVRIKFDSESDSVNESSGSEWSGAEDVVRGVGSDGGRVRGTGHNTSFSSLDESDIDPKLLMDVAIHVRRVDTTPCWRRYARSQTISLRHIDYSQGDLRDTNTPAIKSNIPTDAHTSTSHHDKKTEVQMEWEIPIVDVVHINKPRDLESEKCQEEEECVKPRARPPPGPRRSAGARAVDVGESGHRALKAGERGPRAPEAGELGPRGKRVELPSIEDVRRINSSLLTAQVAPLHAEEAASASTTDPAPEAQSTAVDERPDDGSGTKAEGGEGEGENEYAGLTAGALTRLLDDLALRSVRRVPGERRYCCAARRLRAHHDMRLRLALHARRRPPPRPDHDAVHRGEPCSCCCARLLAPHSHPALLRARQHSLARDIRALLLLNKEKDRARAPLLPSPPDKGLEEWKRQRNSYKRFFDLRPQSAVEPAGQVPIPIANSHRIESNKKITPLTTPTDTSEPNPKPVSAAPIPALIPISSKHSKPGTSRIPTSDSKKGTPNIKLSSPKASVSPNKSEQSVTSTSLLTPASTATITCPASSTSNVMSTLTVTSLATSSSPATAPSQVISVSLSSGSDSSECTPVITGVYCTARSLVCSMPQTPITIVVKVKRPQPKPTESQPSVTTSVSTPSVTTPSVTSGTSDSQRAAISESVSSTVNTILATTITSTVNPSPVVYASPVVNTTSIASNTDLPHDTCNTPVAPCSTIKATSSDATDTFTVDDTNELPLPVVPSPAISDALSVSQTDVISTASMATSTCSVSTTPAVSESPFECVPPLLPIITSTDTFVTPSPPLVTVDNATPICTISNVTSMFSSTKSSTTTTSVDASPSIRPYLSISPLVQNVPATASCSSDSEPELCIMSDVSRSCSPVTSSCSAAQDASASVFSYSGSALKSNAPVLTISPLKSIMSPTHSSPRSGSSTPTPKPRPTLGPLLTPKDLLPLCKAATKGSPSSRSLLKPLVPDESPKPASPVNPGIEEPVEPVTETTASDVTAEIASNVITVDDGGAGGIRMGQGVSGTGHSAGGTGGSGKDLGEPQGDTSSGPLVINATLIAADDLVKAWETAEMNGEVRAVVRVSGARPPGATRGLLLLADGAQPCLRPRYLVCVNGRVRRVCVGGGGDGGRAAVGAGGRLYGRLQATPPLYARMLTAVSLLRARRLARANTDIFVLDSVRGAVSTLWGAPRPVRAAVMAPQPPGPTGTADPTGPAGPTGTAGPTGSGDSAVIELSDDDT